MEAAAYSTVALTLSLVVTRPRLAPGWRLPPAVAAGIGVVIMLALRVVDGSHFVRATVDLWRPFVAIASIMVMTDVAQRVGLLELWSRWIDGWARNAASLFRLVFVLGAATSTVLNNDAAILLLTPLVVALVRSRYPDRPDLLVPFAFAVFVSAGVAALPVSNPMNMVVSEFAGIGVIEYAFRMTPVALACWLVGYTVLARLFREALRPADCPAQGLKTNLPKDKTGGQAPTLAQIVIMVLLGSVLVSYVVFGYLGAPIWPVALGGGVAALAVASVCRGVETHNVILRGVSWQTLAFLFAVLVLALGLFEVGLVDRLASLYQGGNVGTVGVTSALGSAVLNNHPMAYLNMMALDGAGSELRILAALVGGDLGPRLLPIGSLAGLLWLELLRRRGVDIELRHFVRIGAAVTIPTLAAALAVLAAIG